MKFIFITILIQATYQQDQFKISFVHDSIRNRDTKCSEITDFFLARAYKYNRDLKAIINYNPIARLQAQLLDEYYENNSKLIGKLHCIPTIVKDNIDVKEIPTTGGLKALRYSIPNEDALIIKRLRQEGAIFIAKSNMVELGFAIHLSSEKGNGSCQNPFDSSMSCGTSSSGFGVSVSAGLAILDLGTNTSGSITVSGSTKWCLRSENSI
jgi:amidase